MINKLKGVLFAILIIVLSFSVVYIASGISNAKQEEQFHRKYINIEEVTIINGDTLTDIGKNYIDNDTDVRQWIYEVKKLNNMEKSDIFEGETLLIYTK